MKFSINGLDQLTIALSFDNGWTVNLARIWPCKHISIAIIPTYIAEDKAIGTKLIMEKPEEWSFEALIARGDYIEHFDGTDDELIELIDGVKRRSKEKHFRKIGEDIMKAVKS